MLIRSQRIFESEPKHIWPNFLLVGMDDSRPLLFRLGIPKPVICKVLEGEGGRRKTKFRAAGWLWPVRQIGLMLALAQAHRYAARNWRRLSEARRQKSYVSTEIVPQASEAAQ